MKVLSLVLCFLFLLHSSALSSHGDPLRRLLDAKLRSEIDTDLYSEVEVFDDSRLLPQEGLKESDKIEKLPGQPHANFSQYGGYVTVDQKNGRALYYYFVEALEAEETKPLLLWLAGGPGCSSLAHGAMQEIGPFRIFSNGKTLYRNPYSWTKVANLLFLETPIGVGFSYSNTTSDYEQSGDKMTAEDNYVFMRNWLERFPEYKNRDFYIAGESYAGHFVPQLAQRILRHNHMENKTTISLKGIIVGNALINEGTNEIARYDFYWGHSLVSDDTISKIHKFCDFSGNTTSECDNATAEVHLSPAMDVYAIYSPLCQSDNLTMTTKKDNASLKYDPCAWMYSEAYLNIPEVQTSLHANLTNLSYPHLTCRELPAYRDSPDTVLPILQELMDNKLRVWFYSGDTDGILPVTSLTYPLKKLQLPLKTGYHPWLLDGEVGGYTMTYEGDLTITTVREAGHQVPSFEPKRALEVITHFVEGKPLFENN